MRNEAIGQWIFFLSPGQALHAFQRGKSNSTFQAIALIKLAPDGVGVIHW